MFKFLTILLLLAQISAAQNGRKQIATPSAFTTAASIGGIINNYTPVLALSPCDNKIIVEDASSFNAGDTVLLIQMKGAVIDSTNTVSFGNVTDYKNAGNYEFNYVKTKNGNSIELKNKLLRTYDIPLGKVQLVRVPYYNNVTISSTLSCPPWDGNKGGVLVLNVLDSIILNENIDVSGKDSGEGKVPIQIHSLLPVPQTIVITIQAIDVHQQGENLFLKQEQIKNGEKLREQLLVVVV